MDIKSGYKTTEFWVLLLSMAGTYAMLWFGKVDSVQDALAIAAPFLGVVGYGVARSKSKTQVPK
jgi:hypothetical protein